MPFILLCVFLLVPGSPSAWNDDSVVVAGLCGFPDWRAGLVSIGVALAFVAIIIAMRTVDIIGFVNGEDVKILIPT